MPHVLLRASEHEVPMHMQVSAKNIAALALHMGPGSQTQWYPFLGDKVQGSLSGINWKHKGAGQILVITPPPLQ